MSAEQGESSEASGTGAGPTSDCKLAAIPDGGSGSIGSGLMRWSISISVSSSANEIFMAGADRGCGLVALTLRLFDSEGKALSRLKGFGTAFVRVLDLSLLALKDLERSAPPPSRLSLARNFLLLDEDTPLLGLLDLRCAIGEDSSGRLLVKVRGE